MKILICTAATGPVITVYGDRPAYTPVPKILYHGTISPNFDRFAESRRSSNDSGWLGLGFYFTSNWYQAKGYTTKYKGQNRKAKARILSITPKSNLRLYPLTTEEYKKCFEAGKPRNQASKDHAENFTDALRIAGFDGVCYRHPTNEHNLEVMIREGGMFRISDQDTQPPGSSPAPGVSTSAARDSRATAWILVYHPSTNKYLMLKRSKTANNPGLWNFPGGGTDGDAANLGAKRELFEEAGIKVKRSQLRPLARIHALNASYFLLIVDELPTLKVDPKESSKYRWMGLKEIRTIAPAKIHKKTAALLALPNMKSLLSNIQRDSAMNRHTA